MGSIETSTNSTKGASPIHPSFLDRLDQDFIDYYNKHFAPKVAQHSIDIKEIRTNWDKYSSPWFEDFTHLPNVNDIKLKADDGHEFKARIYKPDPTTSPFGEGPYPIYINFHGGGWVFGNLCADAQLCKIWCDRLGIMVMDVDYRLCPENAFGKGHDDAWAAILWVHNNGAEINAIPDSISIGGISAGGNISAVCQQLARDAGLPLKLAVLAVPCVVLHDKLEKPEESPFPSFSENALAPSLNWARIKYFQGYWAPKTDAEREALAARGDFFSNPLYGNLEGICDTFTITASCDPLRDEGEQYAQRLVEAGVRTVTRRYNGVPHPFMHMLGLKKTDMYIEDVCAELKRVHYP